MKLICCVKKTLIIRSECWQAKDDRIVQPRLINNYTGLKQINLCGTLFLWSAALTAVEKLRNMLIDFWEIVACEF